MKEKPPKKTSTNGRNGTKPPWTQKQHPSRDMRPILSLCATSPKYKEKLWKCRRKTLICKRSPDKTIAASLSLFDKGEVWARSYGRNTHTPEAAVLAPPLRTGVPVGTMEVSARVEGLSKEMLCPPGSPPTSYP